MDENPEMVNSYLRFCAYREKFTLEKHIDLEDAEWFYPTTLLPLAEFIKEHKDTKRTMPSNKITKKYISTIMGGPKANAKFLSYCPIVNLPIPKDGAEKALEPLYEVQHNGRYCGGGNAFKYMIGELFDNIYQHSSFTQAFVMAQRYPRLRFTEICVFDNGITIPGSFKQSGKPITPDVQAIARALQGATTKDGERGYGLGTCTMIATVPLKGEIMVVSGSGLVHLSSHGKQPLMLDLSSQRNLHLGGTLVSLRIPINQESIDISKYLESRPSL